MGNPIVHFEIGGRDSDATQTFYRELFGWKIEPMGPAALVAAEGEGSIGGHITSLGHDPHTYVTVYAETNDIPGTLAIAEALGGKTMIPETEIPDMGWFAWFTDIDGNIIGLYKPPVKT